jgi:hypothetical protein
MIKGNVTLTRGERNNNPGNIERVERTIWKGQAPNQSGDSRFVVFTAPVYGIRALGKTLLTYSHVYPENDSRDIDTIREVINRWAPGSENNTAAYIADVCHQIGVGPDDEYDITREKFMRPLAVAIMMHENGRVLYSANMIDDGIRRALA